MRFFHLMFFLLTSFTLFSEFRLSADRLTAFYYLVNSESWCFFLCLLRSPSLTFLACFDWVLSAHFLMVFYYLVSRYFLLALVHFHLRWLKFFLLLDWVLIVWWYFTTSGCESWALIVWRCSIILSPMNPGYFLWVLVHFHLRWLFFFSLLGCFDWMLPLSKCWSFDGILPPVNPGYVCVCASRHLLPVFGLNCSPCIISVWCFFFTYLIHSPF